MGIIVKVIEIIGKIINLVSFGNYMVGDKFCLVNFD